MEEELNCVLLIGEAESAEKAEHIARRYGECPYVNFMATKENEVYATFFLPKRQLWWIKYVTKKPKETFGLEKAKIVLIDFVHHPKLLKIRKSAKLDKVSPCGASCESCPALGSRCSGCPSTIFLKA